MILTPRPDRTRASRHTVAFTLLELLIVITIIIILVALLFPALSGGTERANLVSCLHNMRQLASASYSFAADHDGNLPTNIAAGSAGSFGASWISGSQPVADPLKPKTGDGFDSIKNGCLWSYVNDYRVYLCPTYAKLRETVVANGVYVRSYSWADYMT